MQPFESHWGSSQNTLRSPEQGFITEAHTSGQVSHEYQVVTLGQIPTEELYMTRKVKISFLLKTQDLGGPWSGSLGHADRGQNP